MIQLEKKRDKREEETKMLNCDFPAQVTEQGQQKIIYTTISRAQEDSVQIYTWQEPIDKRIIELRK